jgi:beta-barrel assembly-enhancing protease
MRTIFLLFLLSLSLLSFTQSNLNLNGLVKEKINKDLEVGNTVILTGFAMDVNRKAFAKLMCNDQILMVNPRHLENIDFKPENISGFWKLKAVENGVYESLLIYNFQYNLRNDLEDDALEYLKLLESNNLLFNDAYIENYLLSLAYQIYPVHIIDGRPGFLNIKIIINPTPDAYIFSNGTMFLTTGLISTISTEDELISVMSHEIAHFVLDHSIMNITKAIERQRRAEFWAAVATGLAAAADVYTATQNEFYTPGAITYSTAIIASAIASTISERMGLEYTLDQEELADQCSIEILNLLDRNPNALSSALCKISDYFIVTGNYFALTEDGTHPSLTSRIKNNGNCLPLSADMNYDRAISAVNSFNIKIEYEKNHYDACIKLIERNIAADVAVEKDYLILAMVNMNLFDNEAMNLKALEYIQIAKRLDVHFNINIPKQEALALIRLGRFDEALASMTNYKELIENELSNLEYHKNQDIWANQYFNLTEENEWARLMIYKIQKMKI